MCFDIIVKTADDKGTCVFPFQYKNNIYHDCTLVDGSRPWCAVTENYDVDKKYGYCEVITKQPGCKGTLAVETHLWGHPWVKQGQI